MLSKEELEKKRDKKNKWTSGLGCCEGVAFDDGFNYCTKLLWPEIEALRNNNKELADQRFELMEKVADLERKLAVAKEALDSIAALDSFIEDDFLEAHFEGYDKSDLVDLISRDTLEARTALKEIEGEK